MSCAPRSALARRDHRPWPLPRRPWVLRQCWQHLLFAHWPLPRAQAAAHLPAGLVVDTFEGETWVGVVPFLMTDVAPRSIPALPGLSRFPELNLRLYARCGERRGVFFLSLDAANPLAVRLARWSFGLPYFDAKMSLTLNDIRTQPEVDFTSARAHGGPRFRASYRPSGPIQLAAASSLEHWLTERYCLFTANRNGRLRVAEVHHPPWPLQPAEAEIERCELPRAHQLQPADTSPLLHFAAQLPVVTWTPQIING